MAKKKKTKKKTKRKTKKIRGGMDRNEGQINGTFECPVCLENFSITNGIKCGNNHYTCYVCADNIIKRQPQPSCPICRDENGGWRNKSFIENKAREIRAEERKNDPMNAWYDSDDENEIIRCQHPNCKLFTKLQNGRPVMTHNRQNGISQWRHIQNYGWFCPFHDHMGNQLNNISDLRYDEELIGEGFTNLEVRRLEQANKETFL